MASRWMYFALYFIIGLLAFELSNAADEDILDEVAKEIRTAYHENGNLAKYMKNILTTVHDYSSYPELPMINNDLSFFYSGDPAPLPTNAVYILARILAPVFYIREKMKQHRSPADVPESGHGAYRISWGDANADRLFKDIQFKYGEPRPSKWEKWDLSELNKVDLPGELLDVELPQSLSRRLNDIDADRLKIKTHGEVKHVWPLLKRVLHIDPKLLRHDNYESGDVSFKVSKNIHGAWECPTLGMACDSDPRPSEANEVPDSERIPTVAEIETEGEPESDPKKEPVSQAESDPKKEAVSQAESDPKKEPVSQAESDPNSDPNTKPESEEPVGQAGREPTSDPDSTFTVEQIQLNSEPVGRAESGQKEKRKDPLSFLKKFFRRRPTAKHPRSQSQQRMPKKKLKKRKWRNLFGEKKKKKAKHTQQD